MGILADLQAVRTLSKIYRADVEKQSARDKLVQKGITEDFLRELMRQADSGVVAELLFPSGVTLRLTRTINGMQTETSGGIKFHEEF